MSIFSPPRPASDVGELAAVWEVSPIRILDTSHCLHLMRALPLREKWLFPTMQVDSHNVAPAGLWRYTITTLECPTVKSSASTRLKTKNMYPARYLLVGDTYNQIPPPRDVGKARSQAHTGDRQGRPWPMAGSFVADFL